MALRRAFAAVRPAPGRHRAREPRSRARRGAHHADAPARYEYLFDGDESFQVLEGSASIELLDTGERVDLRAGDIASFDNGTRSVWTFTEPFKKFTVISR